MVTLATQEELPALDANCLHAPIGVELPRARFEGGRMLLMDS